MGNISDIFGGPLPVLEKQLQDPPELQLIQDIKNQGYTPPTSIIFDGEIHRFGKNKSGWYVAYPGRIHAGAYGDWKDGSTINWREDIGRELTTAEQIEHANRVKQIKEASEKARNRKAELAADTTQSIWESALDAKDEHEYLERKQVKNHGLKVTGDGRLIVPVLEEGGGVVSLQYIKSSGDKQFHPGGKTKCGFFFLGSVDDSTQSVFIAEGYATAATIHEQTGQPCFVAFNAGNLPNIAEMVRKSYAGDICVVADNDAHGVGIEKARIAAHAARCRVVEIPEVGMDANDWHNAGNDLSLLINRKVVTDRFKTMEQFCDQSYKPQWIAKHFLERDTLVFMVGKHKGGKSYTAVDMALCMAHGVDYAGMKVKKPHKVVYMTGEGARGLRSRMKAWHIHKTFAYCQNMLVTEHIIKMGDPVDVDSVVEDLQSMGFGNPDVLIIDTFARSAVGLEENSAKDVGVFVDSCDKLRHILGGPAIVVLHHIGHGNDDRGRGSSSFGASTDMDIMVKKIEDGDTFKVEVSLANTKEVDGEVFGTKHFAFKRVGLGEYDEDGEELTSTVLELADAPLNGNEKAHKEKIVDFRKMFEKAWLAVGDFQQGKVVLSRSAFLDYMQAHSQGTKPGTVRQRLARCIAGLEKEGIIEPMGESNLAVTDPEFEAILRVLEK